jgi:hypothetical protein
MCVVFLVVVVDQGVCQSGFSGRSVRVLFL